MRRIVLLSIIVISLLPLQSHAKAAAVDRRDGFLTIWQSIRRPLSPTNEKAFSDVSKDSTGGADITYAKARGIIDDTDTAFHPDADLSLQDALLWLFRTRSVDDVKNITPDKLPDLLTKYPIANLDGHQTDILTADDLLTLMRSLDAKLEAEVHVVSNYGASFQGKGTAFGETFNMFALTAAHRTFPYNTLVKVTNTANGKSVVVRINDRGPYVAGRDMDLSTASFDAISGGATGILHATFERLGDASVVLGCGQVPQYQTSIALGARLDPGVPWNLPLGQSVTWKGNDPYVLLGITYPDGTSVKMQNWLFPDETYSFSPSITGQYGFLLGTKEGRRRELQMNVVDCQGL